MKRALNKIIFPATGLGTRFLPATKTSPREMLTIADKPLIQYGVEETLGVGNPMGFLMANAELGAGHPQFGGEFSDFLRQLLQNN